MRPLTLLQIDPIRMSGDGAVRRISKRAISEVDHRLAKDVALQIGAQPRTAIAIEEAEAEFAGMLVDAAFADARDLSFTHQAGNA